MRKESANLNIKGRRGLDMRMNGDRSYPSLRTVNTHTLAFLASWRLNLRSVCAFAAEDGERGRQEDLEIQAEGPISLVPDVQSDTLVEIQAASPVDLP